MDDTFVTAVFDGTLDPSFDPEVVDQEIRSVIGRIGDAALQERLLRLAAAPRKPVRRLPIGRGIRRMPGAGA